MCPCYSLRIGSALLAFAACVAMSARVLFGADASAFLNAALAGNVAPVAWCWAAVVVVGLWQSVTGLHAAFSHADPIQPVSLAWSAGAIWLVTYYLPHTYKSADFAPANWAWLHAFAVAWAVEHGANIWLQLRGLFGLRRRIVPLPPLTLPAAPSPVWSRRVVVEESYFGGDEPPRTWDMPPAAVPHIAPARVPQIEHAGGTRALPPPAALPSVLPIRRRVR